jgi:Tol biopolymer transport system component
VVDLTGKQKLHISAQGSHLLSAVLSPKEDRVLAIEYGKKGCKAVHFNLPELSKQQLSDCALPNPSSALEWTKEGDSFAFVKSNDSKLSTSIWLYNLTTQSSTQLTDNSDPDLFDTRPRISPDGKPLSFHRGTRSIQNIYVQAIDAPNSSKQVTYGKNRKMCHQWSPDGNSLLVDSNIRGDKNLWLVNISTLQVENLGAKDGQHPMLGNNGKIFAYQEARYQANLWQYNLITGAKSQLIASPKYDNNPAYAPDGKSIAFATNKYGYSAILLYDMLLKQRLLLSIPDKSLLSPQWSPSGEKLLFSAISEQGHQCFELILKTGLYKQIQDDNTPITNCVYANEMHILAISKPEEQASQLISLLEDGSSVQLTQNGASRVRFLNNKTYIFSRSDQKGLYQYSVDTQQTKVLIADYPLTFLNFGKLEIIGFITFTGRKTTNCGPMILQLNPIKKY